MADMEDRGLEWDDVITRDEASFVLLPEGDYNFTVEKYERARHDGGGKLPACNKAVITLRIETDEGTARITHNLFLHTRTEGLVSAFFAAIGLKRKGEPLHMDWSKVTGACGRAKIGIREYTNSNGEKKKANDVKRFYPKEDKPAFTAGDF